jgi:hypothetical protein
MIGARSFRPIVFLIIFIILGSGCGGGSGGSLPQPGATYSGDLVKEAFGPYASAGAGRFELTITSDGTGIPSVSITLEDTRCSNAAGSVTIESGGFSTVLTPAQAVEIVDGRFQFNIGAVDVDGRFTSSTEATATIAISTEENVGMGIVIACDFGSWSWTGNVQ